jgi:hypothetical protein
MPAGTLEGASVGASVLDNAKALLARIKAGLGKFAVKGLDAYTAPDAWALRKAAGVLASGAKKAARFAGQVKDDIAKDVKALASEAWSLSVGPLLLLGGLFWWSHGDSAKTDPLTLAALAYAATKLL